MFVIWEIAAAIMRATNPLADRIFPSWVTILTQSTQELAIFAQPGSPSEGYLAAVQVLASNSVVTAYRVLVGTTIGALVGVAIGLLLAYSRIAAMVMGPLINVLRPIPLLALIPLFVYWFGGQAIGILAFIAFACFVMMVVATFHAATNTPRPQLRFARTLGASRSQSFRTVVIPSMLPELFGTLRNVLALSWSFALGGEYTGAQDGLGFLLQQSSRFGFLGRLVVVVALLTIYAVIVDAVSVRLRRRLIRWQPV